MKQRGESSCQFVRNESVNGEAVAVYSMRRETETLKEDGQVWISKANGRALREEVDVDYGGAIGKGNLSKMWNGQEEAFRMFTIVGVVLLVVVQREPTPD